MYQVKYLPNNLITVILSCNCYKLPVVLYYMVVKLKIAELPKYYGPNYCCALLLMCTSRVRRWSNCAYRPYWASSFCWLSATWLRGLTLSSLSSPIIRSSMAPSSLTLRTSSGQSSSWASSALLSFHVFSFCGLKWRKWGISLPDVYAWNFVLVFIASAVLNSQLGEGVTILLFVCWSESAIQTGWRIEGSDASVHLHDYLCC